MNACRSAVILFILLLAACAREERRPPAPPRIVFSATQHDFGPVEQGTRVRHTFRFVNQGEQDLSIDELRSACDCVATTEGLRVLPPGSEGTIDVEFNTEDVFGSQRRTVTVYANDPENMGTILTLTRTSDGQGGWSESWAGTDPVACRLDFIGGQEAVTGGALVPYSKAIVTLPQATTITAAHRFSHASGTYTVQAVNAGSWLGVKRATLEKI